jgi:hypothetical protein
VLEHETGDTFCEVICIILLALRVAEVVKVIVPPFPVTDGLIVVDVPLFTMVYITPASELAMVTDAYSDEQNLYFDAVIVFVVAAMLHPTVMLFAFEPSVPFVGVNLAVSKPPATK